MCLYLSNLLHLCGTFQKNAIAYATDTFDVDITGTLENQVVMRVGEKRRIVYCSNKDVFSDIEQKSPTKAKVVLSGEDLVSFEELP